MRGIMTKSISSAGFASAYPATCAACSACSKIVQFAPYRQDEVARAVQMPYIRRILSATKPSCKARMTEFHNLHWLQSKSPSRFQRQLK